MATTQTFETIIKLNSQEAKNQLEQLRKKVDDLKAARDKTIQSKQDSSFIKDIKQAMRALKQEMDKTTDPQDYAKLQEMWERCRQRVDEFKNAIEQSETRVNSLNATMKNLGSSSLNELTKASSILQGQLAGMNPQSDEYKGKAAQLATVRQRIDEINASQKAANTTIDRYNQEIQQATAKSSDLKRENELIDRTLKNISGSTMRDLEYSLKLVNEQLRGTKQGTEEYEKLAKSAKQLKTQIAAVNDEQIMPDYFKKLDTETAKQYDLANALSAVNRQYKDKVKNAYLDAKINYEKVKSDYDKNHPKGQKGMPAMMPGATGTPWAYQGELHELDSARKKFEAAEKAYNELNKPFKDPQKPKRQKDSGGGNGGGNAYGYTGNGSGSANGASTNPKDDEYQKESDALKKHLEEEQLALSRQLQSQAITEEDHGSQMYAKKQKYYSGLLALQVKYGKDTTATQQAMVDASMAEAKRLAELDEQHIKESLDARLRSYDEEQMTLVTQRTQGTLTEDEYNEKMKQAEILYHQDRLSIIKEYGGDEQDEQKWLLDQELDDLKQTEEEKRKARLDMLDHKLETADTYDGQRAVIQKMYDEQLITYSDYQDRMTQIAQRKAQARLAVMQQAFDPMNQMLSAASQYSQACSDLEVARITANYDKQIEAAGNNTKKKKKLEEQRDKEIAAAKKKANKRAMVMELAQAVASTAMAAINAYSSAAQVPYVGYILAPIAAATATAAGLLQIATIKKQHQTQEVTGYYEGGFTGGKRYRREAGVVHEGEFVANHMAVNNARILPALQLIDQAQRNNTVGRLTEADVSRALGQNATVVSAPNITVNSSSDELTATMGEARDVIDRLSAILAAGIHASVSIDGPDGVAHQYDTFNKMNSRK